MKKFTMVVLVGLMTLFSTTVFAQTEGANAQIERVNMFGVNPLGLVFNIYSGHYGKIINDGANEVCIPFFYWSPTDDLTLLGGGAKYRFYKDKTGKGVFYGGGLTVYRLDWKYEYLDYDSWTYKTENIKSTTFSPQGEVGYRWSWDNGFTLAPTISLGFVIGEVKSSTGEEAEYGSSGLAWGLGLGLAYMW